MGKLSLSQELMRLGQYDTLVSYFIMIFGAVNGGVDDGRPLTRGGGTPGVHGAVGRRKTMDELLTPRRRFRVRSVL